MKIDRTTRIVLCIGALLCFVAAVLLYLHGIPKNPPVTRDNKPVVTVGGSNIDLPVFLSVKEGWTIAQTDDLSTILYDMRSLRKRKNSLVTILLKEIYSREGHDRLGPRLGGTLYSLMLMSFDCGSWEKALLKVKYVTMEGTVLYDSEKYKEKGEPDEYTPVYDDTMEEKIANAVCARCPERPRGSVKKRRGEPPVTEKPSWSPDTLCDGLKETGSTASFEVRVSKNLPKYKFTITGAFIKENVFDPTRIDITDTSTDRRVQEIKAGRQFGKGSWSDPEDFNMCCPTFQFVDLNYDGYLDMRLLIGIGGTGMDWYATYLYNPKSRKYAYHEELSKLSHVTTDPGNKRIISYDRYGYCMECLQHIRILGNGKLKLEKIEWNDPGRDKLDNIICRKVTAVPHEGVTVYLGNESWACFPDEKEIKSFKKRFRIVSRKLMEGSLDRRERSLLGNPY